MRRRLGPRAYAGLAGPVEEAGGATVIHKTRPLAIDLFGRQPDLVRQRVVNPRAYESRCSARQPVISFLLARCWPPPHARGG